MHTLGIVAMNLIAIYLVNLALMFLVSLVAKFVFGHDLGLIYQPVALVTPFCYAIGVIDNFIPRYRTAPVTIES